MRPSIPNPVRWNAPSGQKATPAKPPGAKAPLTLKGSSYTFGLIRQMQHASIAKKAGPVASSASA
eukprot:4690948-Lingulodinium_polyedra.AAC.1